MTQELSLADLIHISLAQPPSTTIVRPARKFAPQVKYTRANAGVGAESVQCPDCLRWYKNRSGLHSHKRVCKGWQ